MEVSGKLHAPVAPPHDKRRRYPFDRRLESQNRSGCDREEETICPCQESNSGHPDRRLVTVVTELYFSEIRTTFINDSFG